MIITFKKARLGYGRKVVLNDISFTIEAGDYFGIVGPNGAGKTTMLRAILGSLKPLGGTVETESPSGGPLRIGYVPQRDTIDDVLPYTVDEVVVMGRFRRLGLLHHPSDDDRDAVSRSLAHVKVENLHAHAFKDLSGGQKQRVLIARALASEPEALILDEPTNGMDLPSRLAILDLIEDLHEEGGLTVIMVSHLLEDVANYVRHLAIVEREFFQVGSVEDVLTGPNLSRLYNMPVTVERVHDRTIILAGEGHGTR
jgi:ABC-type Mn2+/Zn2+ transport system ATPase subunit